MQASSKRDFSLAPFEDLAAEAHGRSRQGIFNVRSGFLLEGRNGPIGLDVWLNDSPGIFWLPYDYPDFENAFLALRRAEANSEKLYVTFDPDNNVILAVSLTAAAANAELSMV